MSPRVYLHNRQRAMRIDARSLRSFAEHALEACLRIPRDAPSELPALSEINVVLVSDRRIAELHRRFMQISGPTDVITFAHGEIFISVDTARRQARAFDTSTLREVELYIVHGLLHLHGFDDRAPNESRRMRAAERKVLGFLRR